MLHKVLYISVIINGIPQIVKNQKKISNKELFDAQQFPTSRKEFKKLINILTNIECRNFVTKTTSMQPTVKLT